MAKIVYCEDDPTVRKLVSLALRSMPYELYLAENGAEGLELIERERPKVVFTDVSMPVLDGLQLIQEIKSRAHLKHTPVVVVTASVQRHQIEEVHRHGVADFLSKPFAVHELRAKVAQFAGTHH
jgi:CheY-like chemotaxis protein